MIIKTIRAMRDANIKPCDVTDLRSLKFLAPKYCATKGLIAMIRPNPNKKRVIQTPVPIAMAARWVSENLATIKVSPTLTAMLEILLKTRGRPIAKIFLKSLIISLED